MFAKNKLKLGCLLCYCHVKCEFNFSYWQYISWYFLSMWSINNLFWKMMQFSCGVYLFFFLFKKWDAVVLTASGNLERNMQVEFALHMFLLCAGVVYCSAEQIAECPSGGLKQFSREIRNYVAGTVVFHYVWSQTNSLWRVTACCSHRTLQENPFWHYFYRGLHCFLLRSRWRTFLSAYTFADNQFP